VLVVDRERCVVRRVGEMRQSDGDAGVDLLFDLPRPQQPLEQTLLRLGCESPANHHLQSIPFAEEKPGNLEGEEPFQAQSLLFVFDFDHEHREASLRKGMSAHLRAANGVTFPPTKGGKTTVSSQRQRSIAANEAMFREVNETVRDAAKQRGASGPIIFLCECGDTTCAESVTMTGAEYERVRAVATHFAVRPGHVLPDIEIVISRTDAYWIVEKTDEAAEVATETDPRS
jgi:hypothetical protein